MKCRNPECNAEINPNALFCGKCGTLTLSNCSNCGNPLPLTGKVKCCSKCGTMVSEMHPPKADSPKPQPPKTEPIKEDPKPPKPDPPKREPSKPESHMPNPSEMVDGFKKTIQGVSSKNWAMIVHPIISLIFMIVNIVLIVNAGSNPLERGLSILLYNKLLGPMLALMGIGTIFSLVGLFTKKPWAYMTAAIVQSVGFLVGIPVELLDKVYLLAGILLVAVGYVAYYQIHKICLSVSK